MAKDKKIIVVEKISKDEISVGFNQKHIDMWPIAVTDVIGNFIRISRHMGVSDSVLTKTLESMVRLAVEDNGGLKDAVDEVISDENIG